MSYFQRLGDMNYMVEETEMVDFVDEMDGGAAAGVEDVEANEYDLLTNATDTSSGQARNGQDIQGIPWERFNITREKYRLTRLEQYKNYENIPLSGEAVDKRLFFLNGKQDVSAFLLVDLGIIKYPAYSCIIFRTDFLSSK